MDMATQFDGFSIPVTRKHSEVFVANQSVVQVVADDVALLKQFAPNTNRGRVRLCAHPTSADPLHEMIIVLTRSSYVRPHRHRGKSESFNVLEGELDVAIFDDSGAIADVVRMGPYNSGKRFYYRLSEPFFHTPILRSPTVVIHETTNGPFRPAETEYANWAPDENDAAASAVYLQDLESRCRQFVHESP